MCPLSRMSRFLRISGLHLVLQAMHKASALPPAHPSDTHAAGERIFMPLTHPTASRQVLQSIGNVSSMASDIPGAAAEGCQAGASMQTVTLLLLIAFICGVVTMGLALWCFAVCSHGGDYAQDKLYSSSRMALFAPRKATDFPLSAAEAPRHTDSRHANESQVCFYGRLPDAYRLPQTLFRSLHPGRRKRLSHCTCTSDHLYALCVSSYELQAGMNASTMTLHQCMFRERTKMDKTGM